MTSNRCTGCNALLEMAVMSFVSKTEDSHIPVWYCDDCHTVTDREVALEQTTNDDAIMVRTLHREEPQ